MYLNFDVLNFLKLHKVAHPKLREAMIKRVNKCLPRMNPLQVADAAECLGVTPPTWETRIIQWPSAACQYANTVKQERWPEMEPLLRKTLRALNTLPAANSDVGIYLRKYMKLVSPRDIHKWINGESA